MTTILILFAMSVDLREILLVHMFMITNVIQTVTFATIVDLFLTFSNMDVLRPAAFVD